MNSTLKKLIHLPLIALATVACALVWNGLLSVMFDFVGLYSEQPYLRLGWLRTIEIAMILILWGEHRLSIFGSPSQRLKDILWGLGISATGLLAVYGLHFMAISFFHFDLWAQARSPDRSNPLPHLIFFGFLAGPLCEEVFFRATLWRVLHLDPNTWPIRIYAGLWTIFIFSGLHFDFHVPWQQQILSVFVWSSCGALSFGLFWWRKSVLTPWIVHGCANAVLLWPN